MIIEHLGQQYTLTDPKTTSPSAQGGFKTCPGIDWWRYVAGVREPDNEAQALGIATASLVEKYLKGEMTRDQIARDPAVLSGLRPADLALAALGHLPAPLATRVRVEEWLALAWNRPEGMPRIAMKPDVLLLPLIEGVHPAPAAHGQGGSGLFWVPPPFGVVGVEDVKTAKGYGWSLTEETIVRDTQMVWYALAAMRLENTDRARLGQPQVDKKTRTARAVRAFITRDQAEMVFAETEALQREMQDVRAIRDPAELAAQKLLRWDQCANVYGKPCPNFDRCAALKPSARESENQPRLTLAELARLTGRQERGGSNMSEVQGNLGRRLFGDKAPVLSAAEEIRAKLAKDPGTLNPPDGPTPEPTPDEVLGISTWKTGGEGPKRYWIASGERHGTPWNAYGQTRGFNFFAPAWGPSNSTQTAKYSDPKPCGGLDVLGARALVGEALARWDAELGLTAALAPAGWYTVAAAEGGLYMTGSPARYYLAGEPPRAGLKISLYDDASAPAGEAVAEVRPWDVVEPVAVLPEVDELPGEDEDLLPGDPDDADEEATDADELPGDDDPEDLDVVDETPAPDVGDAIAAAVAASVTPTPGPAPVTYDVQAWQARFADAGLPDWASRRIPAELGVTLDELIADPENLLKRMPKVGPGKIQAVLAALQARGVKPTPKATPGRVDHVEVSISIDESVSLPLAASEDDETVVTLVPMTSTLDGKSAADLAEEANNNPFLQKIGEKLVAAQAEVERLRQHTQVIDENRAALAAKVSELTEKNADLIDRINATTATPTCGYVLLMNVKPIPGGRAPLDAQLLEDVLAPHVEAACQRLRVPSLELDPKAFGNPYKELVRELEDQPPPENVALIVDPFSNLWKGVREWFLARRAYLLTA